MAQIRFFSSPSVSSSSSTSPENTISARRILNAGHFFRETSRFEQSHMLKDVRTLPVPNAARLRSCLTPHHPQPSESRGLCFHPLVKYPNKRAVLHSDISHSKQRMSARAASSDLATAVDQGAEPSSDVAEASHSEARGGLKAEASAKPEEKKRVVSGVQPTGSIHLGNYLGAIKNWVGLQITLPHCPEELTSSTRTAAALYLAAGVDPNKASIFAQSHVKAHAELTWLLSCTTPISWLNKMIQFKEKSRKAGEDVGTGLLTYPLLMASDILLYQCDLVPVGEDQRQHLELARDVAVRMNALYGGKKWKKRGGRGGRLFKVPEIMVPPAGARVMSLTDGTAKMSKSAPLDQSRINLLDSADEIANKIKRCKTDSFLGMEFDNPERPECSNLMAIYQIVTGKSREEVEVEVRDLSWGQFKPLLTDAVVAHLEPVQQRYTEIVADPRYVDGIMAKGAEKANEIADKTLGDVYDAMGFMPRQRL